MSVREQTMSAQTQTVVPQQRVLAGVVFVALLAIAGLFIVKWSPYYAKTFVAAAHHSIGSSIVSGKTAVPPHASWAAAWSYALSYYRAIWEALVLALLLGAAVQVFVPRRALLRYLGGNGARPAFIASALAIPGMMCTCCTAPIVVGLRNQKASAGASMAFFLANPVLNPATLLFIGFVLSWKFALLRLILGAALVAVVAWYANRGGDGVAIDANAIEPSPIEDPRMGVAGVVVAWFRALWWEAYTILPGYVVIVLLLGAARAFLFTPAITVETGSIVAVVLLALAGTLFVIPTAGEVPIIQTLMGYGMSASPAAALLLTLPSLSLPSIFIIRNVFSKRVLAFSMFATFCAGILAAALIRF
jgi:uncharacterized membrane protein YraQ (UPF0718 family)